MSGDFSRFTFDPTRHFSGVRMEQGRVQLDADWNEQLDITAHRIETEITDFLGQSGAPVNAAAFGINVVDNQLQIGPGRYYVDGLLVENEATVLFTQQPDYPNAQLPPPQDEDVYYLAFLDVWERDITAVEDPRIREVALGGPDTSARTKTVWQVKLKSVTDTTPADYIPGTTSWQPPASSGTLAARVAQPTGTLGNQLYRVEIHLGSDADGGPTFKWSRDNGSVAARVASIPSGGLTIAVENPGRDEQTWFAANQWVELTDDETVLAGLPGTLVQLSSVDGDVLTVSAWPGGSAPTPGTNAIVRRWDLPANAPDTGLPLTNAENDGWILLEDQIQVQFAVDGPVMYQTGDYWLFASRSLTNSIDWPTDSQGNPRAQPQLGITHHYSALTLLQLATNGDWSPYGEDADLRVVFQPMATGLMSQGGGTMNGPLTIDPGGHFTGLALDVQGDARIEGRLTNQSITPNGGSLAINGSVTIGTINEPYNLEVYGQMSAEGISGTVNSATVSINISGTQELPWTDATTVTFQVSVETVAIVNYHCYVNFEAGSWLNLRLLLDGQPLYATGLDSDGMTAMLGDYVGPVDSFWTGTLGPGPDEAPHTVTLQYTTANSDTLQVDGVLNVVTLGGVKTS